MEPKNFVSEDELQLGLRYLIKDGAASQSMAILTGGAFLVAFAVSLGASNFVIGLLAAIGPLSQLLQLPAVLLVEKVRNRRLITIVAAGTSRMCWVIIALGAILFEARTGIWILLVFLAVLSAFSSTAGCSWNSWMRDLVPDKILGSYFSKRMTISVGVGIIVSLVAAVFLDFWGDAFPEREVEGYSLLLAVGAGIGFLGLYYLSRVPEPRLPASEGHKRIWRLLSRPFYDGNYRKLIAFMGSWNFAVNLAAPFFMVYMLKRLGLSMSLIIVLSIVSQVMHFLFLRLWGKYTDRFSNKSVLAISGPLFILSIMAWTFTTLPERYFLTIPLLFAIHVVMGVAGAGVTLASGNISLKLAPKGEATAYLATNTVVNSIAAGIAPILGGKLADFLEGRELSWTLRFTSPEGVHSLTTMNLKQWDFFFVLAFLFGLLSLYRLKKVKEEGEVDERIVAQEFLSEVMGQVRTLSSAEGVRQMVSFPLLAVKYITERMAGDGGKAQEQQGESEGGIGTGDADIRGGEACGASSDNGDGL